MKQWQPFSRSQPSRLSQICPRVCPTHAGTSCGRSLWKRNGGPLPRGFSATLLSRAASDPTDLGSLWSPQGKPHTCSRTITTLAFQGQEKPTNQPTKNKRGHNEGVCISLMQLDKYHGPLIALPVLLIRVRALSQMTHLTRERQCMSYTPFAKWTLFAFSGLSGVVIVG